jgi:hypothetical protein
MAGDSDAKLTGLAAEILREAVQVFDQQDAATWLVAAGVSMMSSGQVTGAFAGLTGPYPAVTGAFPTVTGAIAAITGSFSANTGYGTSANAGAGLKKVFRLPRKLPALRLPSRAQLAAVARSAPLMTELEALATWLGRDGRLVTANDELSGADAADAAKRIGVHPEYLPYLWDYALTTGWFELADESDGGRTWAVLGETAWRWANGDESGALHVWAAVFAAVTARTLDMAASMDPRASRKLKFQGQGVATAVRLFQARRVGLSGADVSDLLMSGAIGTRPPSRSRRAWDGWVRGHGDPTRLLLSELAALRAIDPPGADKGTIELTPLALWALREQLRLDGIEIPLLKAASDQMSAAALVTFVDGVSEAEGNAEFASWVGSRGPDRAAHELLAFAAFGGPRARLAAVGLVRRIGAAAQPILRDAMQRPELRPYARMALAAGLPEDSVPPALTPDPDDLTRVAVDLLALACGEQDPDPQEIAEQLSEAVPDGQQLWIFGLMSQCSQPDVAQLLTVLGRYHPDRRIAKDARRAARGARKRSVVRTDRVLAR